MTRAHAANARAIGAIEYGLSGSTRASAWPGGSVKRRWSGAADGVVDEQDACDGLLLEPFARVALGDPGSRRELARRRASVAGQRSVETESVADHHRQKVEGRDPRLEEATRQRFRREVAFLDGHRCIAHLVPSAVARSVRAHCRTGVTSRAGTGPPRRGRSSGRAAPARSAGRSRCRGSAPTSGAGTYSGSRTTTTSSPSFSAASSRKRTSGADQRAVRRLDDDQRDAGELALEPGADPLAGLEVVGDVDGRHVVGHRPGEADGLDDVAGDVGRRHDHPLVAPRRADDALPADLGLEPAAPVLPADEQHRADQQRDDDDDQPGAERELGDREDDRDDAGRDRADAVDGDAPPPALVRVRATSGRPSRPATA